MAAPLTWVLADDRAGNRAQCLGVAEALGWPFAVKDISYGRLAALPNSLRGASLVGVAEAVRAALAPPWPGLVIAAGRRTGPVARWLKRQGGAFTVQIMDPGAAGRDGFDLVVVPNHDGLLPARPNLLRVTGAPHRVTAARLAAEAERWRERFAHLPRPLVAVVVGGAPKGRVFTPDLARALALGVTGLGAGALLVTTSRRTGAAAEQALFAALPALPRFDFRWGDAGENPYFGYLALADAVVVTGDSVSMACEACATGGPVYIFAPPGMVGAKHARLHDELFALGLARPLAGRLEKWRHPPLNAAAEAAAAIRERLGPRERL